MSDNSFEEAAPPNPTGYVTPLAFGLGVATTAKSGQLLEVYYHQPCYSSSLKSAAVLAGIVEHETGNCSYLLSQEQLGVAAALCRRLTDDEEERIQFKLLSKLASSPKTIVVTFITEDSAPETVEEAYLKLTLLSKRLVKPHGLNLEGVFSVLPNVAWTSKGAVALEELPERRLEAFAAGEHLEVHSIDKFPKMLNYCSPPGIRVGDGARVRLGAYLGAGTTIMHEGFVNYNAGTAGPNMVEGRISAGVFVQEGTDLGGGCSTMGTLSGGNEEVLSLSKDCLVGANAGTGISLGENCAIEAGLYLTSGSKVEVLNDTGDVISVVKALELSGEKNLLFRRNSLSGSIQALPRKNTIGLNESLHKGN